MANTNILPVTIISKVDAVRLKKELEGMDDQLHQARLRSGNEARQAPKVTDMLEELAKATDVNLSKAEDRQKLLKKLEEVIVHAPVVHISFAVTPSPSFLQKIVKWFRTEADPNILLQIGLQPSIAAGCIVRTPSKYFDFSLHRSITDKQGILIEKLR